ncbi:Arv1 protein [Coprinopsis sp. MPI-PUGE-AT-0042]|nr:Arv1 protein [Coprinopsis sp. MPI-PUGE-AT-0042]
MPIYITCTTPTPYLYTTTETAHNLRLEECSNCKAFVDPYAEFDHLTLFIDLILLKRGVFRHLLYNRGAEPRRVDQSERKKPRNILRERGLKRRILLLKLGGVLTLLDAYIRWCHLTTYSYPKRMQPF